MVSKGPRGKTAEKGAERGGMGGTGGGLQAGALYGPTGRMEVVGPVGKGTLHPHAHDKAVMTKLWDVSEKATEFSWEV